MDPAADSLATYLIDKLKSFPPERRLLVGICGIPASGKTTLVKKVAEKINLLEDGLAVVVGLDGWHFSRAELDKFDDVKEAYDRRGAAFTFDAASYVKFITMLRQSPPSTVTPPPETSIIYAPTFDHSLKDPAPNGQKITPSNRIVLIEGLYTFINTPDWKAAGEALDERWLIDIDTSEATRRLVQRHVVTGVAKDLEEANWRAENNDMPNGLWLLKHMMEPTRRIKSVTEPNV
ncbi:unnamed protein product [Rhizoctonia solani]|uniref:Phosphoribulokinase/uridine kinase domain-containing protein n=1 Tax=Rhizoctonia solani TaxID=456999 RepID=A0A8H3E463_9AGAM|nr:unnamed protein product [Rhizoctonia solani]